jgi:hypothetical protein
LAVAFPLPVAGAPFVQAVGHSAADIIAAGVQDYFGGTIECFQAADYGEQFESLALHVWFDIFHVDLAAAIGGFQGETPMAGSVATVTFGPEEEFWGGH